MIIFNCELQSRGTHFGNPGLDWWKDALLSTASRRNAWTSSEDNNKDCGVWTSGSVGGSWSSSEKDTKAQGPNETKTIWTKWKGAMEASELDPT